MKRLITVQFKDGNKITAGPTVDAFGLFNLGNGMSLNIVRGILYKEKGNVICGEDITDQLDAIEMSMRF